MANSYLLWQGEDGHMKKVRLEDNEDGTFALTTTATISEDVTVNVDTSVLEDIVAKESTLEKIEEVLGNLPEEGDPDTIWEKIQALADIKIAVETLESDGAKEATLEKLKNSSVPEYLWLDTDDPKPDPGDDGFNRAMGVEIDTSTDEITTKYWNGSEWKEVS